MDLCGLRRTNLDALRSKNDDAACYESGCRPITGKGLLARFNALARVRAAARVQSIRLLVAWSSLAEEFAEFEIVATVSRQFELEPPQEVAPDPI